MRSTTLLLLFVICFWKANAKIEQISYRSWNSCYKISNSDIEVIINPSYGGHILFYGIKNLNLNSLWADSEIDGFTIKNKKATSGKKAPDSGRFDFGNERLTQNIHDISWQGPYQICIINDYSVIVTSEPSKESGIQLSRQYSLDEYGSRLKITQTMKNISDKEVKYCHWSRTLLPAGGVYLTQMVKTSKYPKGFAQFLWGPDRIYEEKPSMKKINIVNDSIFIARPGGESVKYGIMTSSGWGCYVNNRMMFVKQFDLDLAGEYDNNLKAEFPNMIYFDKRFIEIEPNSVMVRLKPGESNSYSEKWWLFNYLEETEKTSDALNAYQFAQTKLKTCSF